jgi:hypothetical protein
MLSRTFYACGSSRDRLKKRLSTEISDSDRGDSTQRVWIGDDHLFSAPVNGSGISSSVSVARVVVGTMAAFRVE